MSVCAVYPVSPRLSAAYQPGNLVLRSSLRFGNSLGVGIQSDATGRMPEQLLDNLDVGAARAQERCARVPAMFPET